MLVPPALCRRRPIPNDPDEFDREDGPMRLGVDEPEDCLEMYAYPLVSEDGTTQSWPDGRHRTSQAACRSCQSSHSSWLIVCRLGALSSGRFQMSVCSVLCDAQFSGPFHAKEEVGRNMEDHGTGENPDRCRGHGGKLPTATRPFKGRKSLALCLSNTAWHLRSNKGTWARYAVAG